MYGGIMADLIEAEIQVLASLFKAEDESLPRDKASLEKGGERFWRWQEDWSDAYGSLLEKGLIEGDDSSYRLTEDGRPIGRDYHHERPDRMWYYFQRLYEAVDVSPTFARFCEQVFGKNLCQEGMADIDSIDDLIAKLGLGSDNRFIDLGCGIGGITGYIADQTGAHATGLDYSKSAVEMARNRFAGKEDRLTFTTGDMNHLDLPEGSFDAAIMIDTLYWVANIADSLKQIARTIKPGGQMGILHMHGPWHGDPPGTVPAEDTGVGKALVACGFAYEAHDYTAQNFEFYRRFHRVMTELRDDFIAEGYGFIPDSNLLEVEGEILPAMEANKMTRYLYHVRL
jgi:ubiquinone/menaquinone biosynthesis C-methylase UbiE